MKKEKKKCIDCGNPVSRRTGVSRCRKCYEIFCFGKKDSKCIDCGTPINNRGLRCKRCSKLFRATSKVCEFHGREKLINKDKTDRSYKCALCRTIQVLARTYERFANYGYVCACCGEARPLFLNIDHIDGTGSVHREQFKGSGTGFFGWLKANNYPKDNFQLLCSNCNFSKRATPGTFCPEHIKEDRRPLDRRIRLNRIKAKAFYDAWFSSDEVRFALGDKSIVVPREEIECAA